MKTIRNARLYTIPAILIALGLLTPSPAKAHCDTMDGPVVKDAKTALAKGDVTPVLKWIKKESEPEIRQAFRQAVAVRSKGADAKELADTYFFETLVRVHRAGEGAAFTGLKPAGIELEPAIAGADKALDTGSAATLVKTLTEEIAAGINKRFAEVAAKRASADKSPVVGREYVAAYVEFIHYVERLHQDALGLAAHREEETPQPAAHKEARAEEGHAD